MKRFLFLLAFAILFSATFLQCKRCKDKNLGEHDLTQTDQNIVPYIGNETLIFKDSSNDSIFYKGSGRSSVIASSQNNSEGDCAGDYYNYELNHTQFIKTINHRSIDVYLGFSDSVPTTIYKSFTIGLDYPYVEEGHFQGHYYFNDMKLIQFKSGGRIKAFNDSLVIGPKKFYTVYTLFDDLDTNKVVFYSISRGVVGFINAAGNLRYLAH
jgi:hypothetical protein